MTAGCNRLALVRLMRGELGEDAAAAVSEHTEGCTDCGADLTWLVSQRELYGRPPPEPSLSAVLWRRISSAIAS